MSAVILGATGLCGSSFLKNCESSKRFAKVYVLGRRPLPFASDAVQLVEKDTTKWGELFPDDNIQYLFTGLATTRGVAGFEHQYKIDHDLNVEMAKVAKKKGCSTIILVSSAGSNEKSILPYFRMKGEIERDILALNFDQTIILRPGALLGTRLASIGLPSDISAKLCGMFYRTRLQKLIGYPVYGHEVGKVGVHLAVDETWKNKEKIRIVESSEILDIAAKIEACS